jgi:hypothetical protein
MAQFPNETPALPEVHTTEDWHRKGLFIMVDPQGEYLMATLCDTAYSTRAEFVRNANRPWSRAVQEGYRVVELTPSQVIADARHAA